MCESGLFCIAENCAGSVGARIMNSMLLSNRKLARAEKEARAPDSSPWDGVHLIFSALSPWGLGYLLQIGEKK